MRIATITAALGLTAFGVFMVVKPAETQTQTAAIPPVTTTLLEDLRALQEEPLKVYPFDRVMGSADAPVTIIEYASLTCSHCAHFHEDTLPYIEREWIKTGKAKYVLRDLPWDNLAFAMGKTARCAPQENYFRAVAAIMKNQEAIVTSKGIDGIVAKLAEVVEPFGLSSRQVNSCINGSADDHAIIAAMKDSALKSLGVQGTPVTFVNGQKIDGAQPYNKVKPILQNAYDAATKGK